MPVGARVGGTSFDPRTGDVAKHILSAEMAANGDKLDVEVLCDVDPAFGLAAGFAGN